MILVIDNYDSFTYNLVQYLGELGAEPLVYRNDAITIEQMPKMSAQVSSARAETPALSAMAASRARSLPSAPTLVSRSMPA